MSTDMVTSSTDSLAAQIQGLANRRISTLTSLDMRVPSQAAAALAAKGGSDHQLSDRINTEIRMVHFLIHTYTKVDENGETADLLRTVIIDDAGKSYSCSSNGVIDSLVDLMCVIGQPPWSQPVLFNPVLRSTKHPTNKVLKLEFNQKCITEIVTQLNKKTQPHRSQK